ncbi:hematopoietically-expressed homeobox protein hhex [Sitodiplosis mosellana]|uniref:hematopoietically-expressed homeobox protein hhex n=1 Tax=Sitodiplosis mosellana TaxID=263140 RepID=UPI002445082C|nr:hematopoietically-expressed homeobox protein hhex [Sitodiplosis mosellana]
MCSSNLKSSFSIDEILCQSATRSSVSVPAASAFTDLPMAFNNSLNGRTQFLPNLFDLIPPRCYFPHASPQPTPPTYIDPYANVFQKATPSGYMPYYSHPFGGCTFKRKGGQVRFTSQQTQHLEQQFNSNKYLSPDDRKQLAVQLKLSDRQVKTWFQNRRAKWRRGITVIKSSSKNESSHPNSPTTSGNYTSSADKLQTHCQFNHFVDSTMKPCFPPTD